MTEIPSCLLCPMAIRLSMNGHPSVVRWPSVSCPMAIGQLIEIFLTLMFASGLRYSLIFARRMIAFVGCNFRYLAVGQVYRLVFNAENRVFPDNFTFGWKYAILAKGICNLTKYK